MPNSQSAKGNPAHKRMANAKLKARRAASWARGQVRKATLRQTAVMSHRRNLALIEAGELTPWQAAKAKRLSRRKSERDSVRNERTGG